jgi:hypothetical protein
LRVGERGREGGEEQEGGEFGHYGFLLWQMEMRLQFSRLEARLIATIAWQ